MASSWIQLSRLLFHSVFQQQDVSYFKTEAVIWSPLRECNLSKLWLPHRPHFQMSVSFVKKTEDIFRLTFFGDQPFACHTVWADFCQGSYKPLPLYAMATRFTVMECPEQVNVGPKQVPAGGMLSWSPAPLQTIILWFLFINIDFNCCQFSGNISASRWIFIALAAFQDAGLRWISLQPKWLITQFYTLISKNREEQRKGTKAVLYFSQGSLRLASYSVWNLHKVSSLAEFLSK